MGDKAILKKLGVMSVAKLEAVVFAVVGLIEGIVFAIASTIISSSASAMGIAGLELLAELGVLAIIILPIVLGIFGFIAGAIGALIYNLIAGKVGGIEMEFEEKAA